MINNNPCSPKFICGLIDDGVGRNIIRSLIKEYPQMDIFEACARNEITPEQGAVLLMIQKESKYVVIRAIRKILDFISWP
jgi:hypothetical protein